MCVCLSRSVPLHGEIFHALHCFTNPDNTSYTFVSPSINYCYLLTRTAGAIKRRVVYVAAVLRKPWLHLTIAHVLPSFRYCYFSKDGGVDLEDEIFDNVTRFLRNARDVARMVNVDTIYT